MSAYPARRFSSNAVFAGALAAIFIVGAALRCYHVTDRGFWDDEIDLWLASVGPWRSQQMAPLPPLLQGLWISLPADPTSMLWFRIPSLILGSAAVLSISALATRLFDREAGVAAAAFMAISPMAIYYSQEARPYALLLLLVPLSIYFLLQARSRGGWTDLLACSALLFLCSMTHALASLIGLGMVVWCVGDGYLRRNARGGLISAFVLAVGSGTGLGWVFFRRIPVSSVVESSYSRGLEAFVVESLRSIGPDVMQGPRDSSLVTLTAFVLLAGVAAGAWRLFQEHGAEGALPLCASAFLLTILFITLGDRSGWKWDRYLSPLLPLYLSLLAGGCYTPRLRKGGWSSTLVFGALLLFLPGLSAWARTGTYDRSAHPKRAAQQLALHTGELDGFIVIAPWYVPRPIAIAAYAFHRQDALATYMISDGKLKFFEDAFLAIGVTPPDGDPADRIAPGRYLVVDWEPNTNGKPEIAAALGALQATRSGMRVADLSDQTGLEVYEFR